MVGMEKPLFAFQTWWVVNPIQTRVTISQFRAYTQAGANAMEYTVGCVTLFPYNFVPMDWLLCDGSTVSISEFSTLYAVIGTRYGGDGINNFRLPDLRGAIPNDHINYYIAYNGLFPAQS
jgi:microcystin-dependent protein